VGSACEGSVLLPGDPHPLPLVNPAQQQATDDKEHKQRNDTPPAGAHQDRPTGATTDSHCLLLGGIFVGVQQRRRHEIAEQGMRCIGARLELWMELASHHPRMVTNLADLDEQTIRR